MAEGEAGGMWSFFLWVVDSGGGDLLGGKVEIWP